MTDHDDGLTPEQRANLDKQASICAAIVAVLLVGSWLLFIAAVWFASWRYAGLGLLALFPAGLVMLYAILLRNSTVRKIAAEKARERRQNTT